MIIRDIEYDSAYIANNASLGLCTHVEVSDQTFEAMKNADWFRAKVINNKIDRSRGIR